jgi:uncharacterized protein YjbI with pentapeptide repeats
MTTDNSDPTGRWYRRLENWITAHWWLFLLAVVAFLIFLLLFYWAIQPDAAPPWTGFGGVTTSAGTGANPSRTLWDWLDLLLVPVVLASGFILVSRSLRANHLRTGDAPESTLDKDSQEQTALENYLDRMEELLLDRSLLSAHEGDQETVFARARTLSVLPNLNGHRKAHVVRFLHEAQLIEVHKPVIELNGAEIQYANLSQLDLSKTNLSGANLSESNLRNTSLKESDLSEINLSKADLGGAELRETLLSDADLSHADLCLADLRGADLSGACLIGSDLSGAHLSEAVLSKVDLSVANLNGAYLSKANLYEANLSEANLNEANLSRADLSRSFLRKAKLSGTNLGEADISYADLSGADLRGTVLREANLFGANLSDANLTRAQYSTGTSWPPDGFDLAKSGAILVDDSGQPVEEVEEEA